MSLWWLSYSISPVRNWSADFEHATTPFAVQVARFPNLCNHGDLAARPPSFEPETSDSLRCGASHRKFGARGTFFGQTVETESCGIFCRPQRSTQWCPFFSSLSVCVVVMSSCFPSGCILRHSKGKQLDITTTQNLNELKKRHHCVDLRTAKNTPTFRFYRRGTRTQTISVQGL
jgi:hypothetical protein